MAFYLLIDTSILRRLISKDSISEILLQLSFSIKKKDIILLYPKALQEEWQKHKEEERKIIAKKLKEWEVNLKRQKTINHMMADFTEQQIEALSATLNSQIDIIDELLTKYAIQLPRKDDIDLKILNWHDAKKAPFHILKKDNFNDARIIFYSVDYLEKNTIGELYFISGNTDDFAIKEGEQFELHPDLHTLSQLVKIKFEEHISNTLEELFANGLQKRETETGQRQNQRRVKNVIQIDQGKPILDQVFEYLEKRFIDLVVIPKEIFAEHYPFIINSSFVFVHRPFSVITDNKELYNLLTKVKIENGDVIEDELNYIKTDLDREKIIGVFKYLRQNLIYNIAFERGDPLTIHYRQSPVTCDCMDCLLNHLRLDVMINKLYAGEESAASSDILQMMKRAYAYYKMRDFLGAAKQFEQIRDSRKEKNDLLYYILSFNLYNLGGLIMNTYFGDSVQKKRGNQLRSIDLERIFEDCKTQVNQKLLEWIHLKLFHKDSLAKLLDETAQIRDLFYKQSGGANEHPSQVLETYYVAASFLESNAIIYDIYTEFHELTDVYTEAIFASHGCSKRLGGRFQYFDENRLSRLALYGKAENIQKFIRRYKLKRLEYRASEENNQPFVDRFIHLLEQLPKILETHERVVQPNNGYFKDFYIDILFNCIVLLGLLDLRQEVIEDIAEKLLVLQKSNHKLNAHLLLPHLNWLFSKYKSRLSAPIITKYVQQAIDDGDYHDNSWFGQLSDILEDLNSGFQLPENSFESSIENFLEECKMCKRVHDNIISYELFKIITNPKQKKYIIDIINRGLKKSFDSDKYYLATTGGIIEPVTEYTSIYSQEIEDRASEGQRLQFMPRTEFYTDSVIDQYLNFCFKFKLNIRQELGEKLQKLGPYYEWLLNLDTFDYTRFDHSWIFIHFTLYYKRRFSESLVLKDYLFKVIRNDPTNELAVKFVFIYGIND